MNICPHCQIGFKEFCDYSDHIKANHMVDPLKSKAPVAKPIMRPIKLTSRSTRQIVHDQEKIWGEAIYPTIKPWHSMEAN